jgi:hypothetical protein
LEGNIPHPKDASPGIGRYPRWATDYAHG